jgi:hypothetical protein
MTEMEESPNNNNLFEKSGIRVTPFLAYPYLSIALVAKQPAVRLLCAPPLWKSLPTHGTNHL